MLNSLSRRVGYVYRFERHTTRRPKNCTGTNIGRDVEVLLIFFRYSCISYTRQLCEELLILLKHLHYCHYIYTNNGLHTQGRRNWGGGGGRRGRRGSRPVALYQEGQGGPRCPFNLKDCLGEIANCQKC